MLLLLTQFSAIIFRKPILMLVLRSSACYVAAIADWGDLLDQNSPKLILLLLLNN